MADQHENNNPDGTNEHNDSNDSGGYYGSGNREPSKPIQSNDDSNDHQAQNLNQGSGGYSDQNPRPNQGGYGNRDSGNRDQRNRPAGNFQSGNRGYGNQRGGDQRGQQGGHYGGQRDNRRDGQRDGYRGGDQRGGYQGGGQSRPPREGQSGPRGGFNNRDQRGGFNQGQSRGYDSRDNRGNFGNRPQQGGYNQRGDDRGFNGGGRPSGGFQNRFQDGPQGNRGRDMREPREDRNRPPKPNILEKDNFVLIVNKPAGIPTRRGQSPTLVDMVEELSGARRRLMRVAHELDTQASGIVLFVAMRDSVDSPRTQTHPETSYLALVEGVFSDEVATRGESITGSVSQSSGLGATPSTHIRVVESGNGLTLLRVRARPDLPEQIREHLAQIGHPIVGDFKHGATRDDLHRLGLHANGLRITHPEEDKTVRYSCQASASFWVAMGVEPPSDAQINESDEKDPSSVQKGWDHVAGWYEGLISQRGSDHHQKIVLPGVMNLLDLKPNERVLDVACGQGVMSEYITTHSDVDHVHGTDISDTLIEAAKSRATERTSYEVWDATKLSELEHEPVDAATCVLALMNIENLEAVFQGVYDRLKPGGRFVCVINHPSFRIAGSSAWGWTMDERTNQQLQFRRVDHYLSEKSSQIVMNPGEVAKGQPAVTTVTYHRALSSYVQACAQSGMMVNAIEEWASQRMSEPGPRAAAENTARREIPLFLAIRCQKPAQT